MNTSILENIGFTKGEIKVYVALLELGSSTSGPIITKSKVSRSKVYEILERLKEKGVVSEVIKDQVRYFQSLTPKKILEYLKSKESTIAEQKEELQKILPELMAKQKFTANKQDVKVYLGTESIKTYFEEMVEKLGDDEYLGTSFSDDVKSYRSLLLMFHKFHVNRAKRGIKAKIVCSPDDILNKNLKNNETYEFRNTKIHIPKNISIFKDTIAMFHWGEQPKVFAITNKETAEDFRKFFNDIWKISK